MISVEYPYPQKFINNISRIPPIKNYNLHLHSSLPTIQPYPYAGLARVYLAIDGCP